MNVETPAAEIAAQQGTIAPILIGREGLIHEAAERAGIALAEFEMMPAANPREAVAVAIQLARERKIEGILKGSVSTEELISVVISKSQGLRTGRRPSGERGAREQPHRGRVSGLPQRTGTT